MRSRITPMLLAAPLAAVLLLSACAAVENGSGQPSASASPDAASTTTATEPITGAPGDPLTAEQAKQLNGQRGTLRPYETSDGSFIIVDMQQPLPELVRQEVAQAIGAVGNDTGSSGSEMLAQSAATGKTIVLIRRLQTSNDAGQNITTWASMSEARAFPFGVQGDSAESVISRIQPWVDAQNNPAQFEIIVVDD
ncbi:hypothetical protein ACFWHT_02145 [Microbacterium sp. NPDC058342]|uniref:hypothetical protein n=1 Tax=Microbacterium sp. NPDC058342 TaxID=3346454 RepID=UPI0036691A41